MSVKKEIKNAENFSGLITEINHKIHAYLDSGVQEVIIVGLTGTIEYIRQDGVHPTSIFNLTLSLPAQLFS